MNGLFVVLLARSSKPILLPCNTPYQQALRHAVSCHHGDTPDTGLVKIKFIEREDGVGQDKKSRTGDQEGGGCFFETGMGGNIGCQHAHTSYNTHINKYGNGKRTKIRLQEPEYKKNGCTDDNQREQGWQRTSQTEWLQL